MINFDSYHHLNDLPGFLHFREGCQLLEWAATWPADGLIVELGSFLGKSTAFLVEGDKIRRNHCIMASHDYDKLPCGGSIKPPEVWAIDHWKGSKEHQADQQHPIQEILDGEDLFKKFCRIMNDGGWLHYIRPIVKDHDKVVWEFADGEIRLLFIDGEHDYESTKRNFELWYPKVVSGGLIVLHDNDDAHPGVQKYVKELMDGPTMTYEKIEAPKSLAAFVKR